MGERIRVVSITPLEFYQRVVRMVNEDTGQQREIVYGESVSDRWIRRRAPMAWKRATTIQTR